MDSRFMSESRIHLPFIGGRRLQLNLRGETRTRSLTKTLVYRTVVIGLLAAVTYAFTGNVGETTLITVVFNAAGSVVYFGFERLWDSINWGTTG